jgi:hypothetical protein
MSYAPFPLVWGFFGRNDVGPAFGIIQTDFGTYPTASGGSDILTLISADSAAYYFTGTALTDTITLSINTSSASQKGLLSSTDWSTFNSKVDRAGDTMTGNLTVPNLLINAITQQNAASAFSGLVIDNATGTIKTAPVTTGLQPVIENTLTTPPSSPNAGDSYLVPSGATGAWSGQTNKIATWSGSAWTFYTPSTNDQTTVLTGTNAGKTYIYNGTSWIQTNVTVSAWQLNGNTVGSVKTLGTLDSYDLPFITGAVERMRLVQSTGLLKLNSLSSGSVPYIDSSSQVNQDTQNFWWDTSVQRLLVGNAATGISYPVSGMTSNTLPTPLVASASGSTGADLPWKSFDKNPASTWFSTVGLPQWIAIDFGTSITINSYSVQGVQTGGSALRAPNTWQLQTSPDNTTWTTVNSQSGQSSWTAGEIRTFSISSTSSRYWRYYITANNGDAYTAVAELSFANSAATRQSASGKITVSSTNTNEAGIVVNTLAGQVASAFQIRNSAAAAVLSIPIDGSIVYGTQYSFGTGGGYTTVLSGSNGIAFRDRSTTSPGTSTIFWTLLNTSGITSFTPAAFTTASTLTAQSYSQTWNNASGTFTGSLINITNTASGVNSRIFDYQVGGVSNLSMTPTGFVGINTSTPSARLHMGTTALSASAWGSSGIAVRQDAVTYTDTSTGASTTVSTNMVNAIATPTLAATNTAVTYTDASTFYLAGPPTAGTNVTLTNAYTAYSNSGAWFHGGTAAAPVLAGSQSTGDRIVLQNTTGGNVGKLAIGTSAVNQFYIQAYGTTASPRFNIFTTNSTTAPMVSIQSGAMVVGTGASGALSGSNATFEILANGGSSGLRVGYNNNTTSGFYISDTNASGTYVGNARTSAQTPQAVGTANGLIQFNAAVMTFYSDTGLTSGNTYTPTRRMSLDRGWWTLGAFASNTITNYLGTFYTGYTVNATGSGASGYFVTTRNTNSMISATGAYYNSTNMTATETSSAGYWQDAGAHRFFTNTGLTVGNTFGATEQFRIDSTGYVGVGVTSPSALLSIAGSTTTRASMNIATGTAPTSPNSGDVWHDATQKTTYINNAGVNQSHSGTLFTQTSDATCANTTTETTLTSTGVGTLTLPANFFVSGKTIKLQAYGFHSSTSGATLTIRVKLGSTTILTATGSSGTDTNAVIIMDTMITCRTTGASGTVAGQGVYSEMGNSPNFRQMVNTSTVTVDTTASQAITMTAQWSAAAAGRTITVTNLSVQVLN